MGIVNATEDSFSGDGLGADAAAALAHARAQIAAGSDILDLGAESTRPGARPVPAEVEIQRLVPLIRALKGEGVPISVDTRYSATMRAALEAGADIINDITALKGDAESLDIVADFGCPVVLMHMQGEPGNMQADPKYTDVVEEVYAFLARRVDACMKAGIPAAKIAIDPGIGFGKKAEHNVALLRALPRFHGLGCPVLIGLSRKSVIGQLAAEPDPAKRLPGSLAGALYAAVQGADILRVHDVAETCQALKVWQALRPVA